MLERLKSSIRLALEIKHSKLKQKFTRSAMKNRAFLRKLNQKIAVMRNKYGLLYNKFGYNTDVVRAETLKLGLNR